MQRTIIRFLCVSLLSFLLLACGKHYVEGNGKITTENRKLGNFEAISLAGGNFRLELDTGKMVQPVQVIVDSNIQSLIVTKVQNNLLTIKTLPGYTFKSTQPIIIRISIPLLKNITAAGQSQIVARDIQTPNFSFIGSGNLQVMLTGQSDASVFHLTGVTNIDASNFKSKSAEVDLAGQGTISTYVSERLLVQISGTGKVIYYGKPPLVEQSISGVGVVQAAT